MAEATSTAFGVIEGLDSFPVYGFVTGNDHLGDAFTIVDNKRFVREIDQDDADFAPIVGIDGTRRVGHGDTVLQSQTGTRTYLRLDAMILSTIFDTEDINSDWTELMNELSRKKEYRIG